MIQYKNWDTNIMIDKVEQWSEIDWKYINQNLKNLRVIIYKEKRDDKLRKLRDLQRLMLKSVSNILYSIRYLGSNSGSKTPGVDGIYFLQIRMVCQ